MVESWSTKEVIDQGIESTGTVKLYAQHTYVPISIELISREVFLTEVYRYQYSTCDPARNSIATLTNLINHQNITVCFLLY